MKKITLIFLALFFTAPCAADSVFVPGIDNSAWINFTASPTCNTGVGTWVVNNAHYKAIGKTIVMQLDATLSAVGTCTGSAWRFNLPVTSKTAGGVSGGEIAINGASVVCAFTGSGSSASCNNAGLTMGTGQQFGVSGVYEGQ